MKQRRGLPGQLEQEIHDALLPIYLKYRRMQKSHMSKDRIVGLILCAFADVRSEGEQILREERKAHGTH